MSGGEPLMNLEIRFGVRIRNVAEFRGGNKRITGSERCGMYYGPTLVPHQCAPSLNMSYSPKNKQCLILSSFFNV